jgi:hypothetical protein
VKFEFAFEENGVKVAVNLKRCEALTKNRGLMLLPSIGYLVSVFTVTDSLPTYVIPR